MFDWFFSLFNTNMAPNVVYPPYPPPVIPKDLPYDAARALLHRQPDVPFYNKFWDYPVKGGPDIEYSEKMTHIPLFSSVHQFMDTKCVGKLHFSKSIHPEQIVVDKTDSAVLLKPKGYVISAHVPKVPKVANISKGEPLPINYRIGGSGPGGPEMSFNGPLSSPEYQRYGPHYLGRQLKDGSYCIEPSAMDMRENVIRIIPGDTDGSVREYMVRTS